MKYIALAILSVGLCFYNVYRYVEVHKRQMIDGEELHTEKFDGFAALVSIIAAAVLIFS